jgi:hypothetical protein
MMLAEPATADESVNRSKILLVRLPIRGVSMSAMSRAFNVAMRVISSLIGVLMILMGGIWILQGLNLAWGSLSRSFMQGDQHWVFYGAIMLIVGVCQVVWSNTRQRE